MNYFISLFLPCILGIFIYYVCNGESNKFELLIIFLVNVLISNLFGMGVLFLKSNYVYSLIIKLEEDYRFAFKYMLLLTLISIIIGFISIIIKKYLIFDIEVENGAKKK